MRTPTIINVFHLNATVWILEVGFLSGFGFGIMDNWRLTGDMILPRNNGNYEWWNRWFSYHVGDDQRVKRYDGRAKELAKKAKREACGV
tara:strand:+ start:2477 stop:2743 length:267 start_codon:yes stop_codon:yes gene_type:complete